MAVLLPLGRLEAVLMAWNQVYEGVVRPHQALGYKTHLSSSTWTGSRPIL